MSASPSTPVIPVSDSAKHAALTTQPIAEKLHTTIVNALSTPTIESLHDHKKPTENVILSPAMAEKRAAFIAGGVEKLQIIADFDRTISAFKCSNGSLCAASHQLLESCVVENYAAFRSTMDAINTKYFELEISSAITEAERASHMGDWWQQAHDLLVQQDIKHQSIEAAVRKARTDGDLQLRTGAREFLHTLNEHNIPCLIFSAGVKETIKVTFEQEKLFLPCMHLIGNETFYNKDTGALERFDTEMITSSNKNYTHVLTMQPDYHQKSLQRRNVIVIGDNIGDANMAKGMEGIENIIRIGLLHDNVELRLEQFKAAFDVVLLGDPDMSFLHNLVKDIISASPKKNNQAE